MVSVSYPIAFIGGYPKIFVSLLPGEVGAFISSRAVANDYTKNGFKAQYSSAYAGDWHWIAIGY